MLEKRKRLTSGKKEMAQEELDTETRLVEGFIRPLSFPILGKTSVKKERLPKEKEPLDVVAYSPLLHEGKDSFSSPPDGFLSWWCPVCDTTHAIPVKLEQNTLGNWLWTGGAKNPVLNHCVHNSCGEHSRTFILSSPYLIEKLWREDVIPLTNNSQGRRLRKLFKEIGEKIPPNTPYLTVDLLHVPSGSIRRVYRGPLLPLKYWPKEGSIVSVQNASSLRSQHVRKVLENL